MRNAKLYPPIIQQKIDLLIKDLIKIRIDLDTIVREYKEVQDAFEICLMQEENEKKIARQKGEVEVILAFLPVCDDLERAITNTQNDVNFCQNLQNLLQKIIKALKVEIIPTVGKMYDIHLHEAVERIETSEYPTGTIIREIQKGYKYQGTLLRPAKVAVAVAIKEEEKNVYEGKTL